MRVKVNLKCPCGGKVFEEEVFREDDGTHRQQLTCIICGRGWFPTTKKWNEWKRQKLEQLGA